VSTTENSVFSSAGAAPPAAAPPPAATTVAAAADTPKASSIFFNQVRRFEQRQTLDFFQDRIYFRHDSCFSSQI